MQATLRILTAAAISTAAFAANAATGDMPAYPAGIGATTSTAATSQSAPYRSSYVWTNGEAGLVRNNAPAGAMQAPEQGMPMRTSGAPDAMQRAADRPAIFLGA